MANDQNTKTDKDLINGTEAQRIAQGGRDNTNVSSDYDQSLRPGQPGYDADRDFSNRDNDNTSKR